MMHTKQAFCSICQAVTEHSAALDKNNEIALTCKTCSHLFGKHPLTDDPAELQRWIDAHQSNAGQVTVETAAAAQAVHDERFKKLMGIA
jgi:transcription elongation factor Elf1